MPRRLPRYVPGKTIALANKEVIVCAGQLAMQLAEAHGVSIRPVDSEHSAIWQAIGCTPRQDVQKLILTASGGPFRDAPDDLRTVTPEQALRHPTWSMGRKITIDSATLMNKGLELIEAHWLFDVSFDNIEVVIHPESIVHSVVEFVDGAQIAQMSVPDMRLPIQYALTYPERLESPTRRLSLSTIGTMRFFEPDVVRFPALRLAREAGRVGGTLPTVLSAADEVAVQAFADGRIPFPAIPELVERTMDAHPTIVDPTLGQIFEADRWAREHAAAIVDVLSNS